MELSISELKVRLQVLFWWFMNLPPIIYTISAWQMIGILWKIEKRARRLKKTTSMSISTARHIIRERVLEELKVEEEILMDINKQIGHK